MVDAETICYCSIATASACHARSCCASWRTARFFLLEKSLRKDVSLGDAVILARILPPRPFVSPASSRCPRVCCGRAVAFPRRPRAVALPSTDAAGRGASVVERRWLTDSARGTSTELIVIKHTAEARSTRTQRDETRGTTERASDSKTSTHRQHARIQTRRRTASEDRQRERTAHSTLSDASSLSRSASSQIVLRARSLRISHRAAWYLRAPIRLSDETDTLTPEQIRSRHTRLGPPSLA